MFEVLSGCNVIGHGIFGSMASNSEPPQSPNYDNIEMEGIGSLTLPNSLKAPFEKFELSGNSKQGENPSPENPQEIKNSGKYDEVSGKYVIDVSVTGKNLFDVDAVRNENGYLNSDSQIALDTNRFDIVEGRQYLLISKGSTLTDGTGYSTPYFGEDDLRYGLNHLNILGINPGYQMFTKNERRKVILKAKKSTTITKFIVHGYNRVNDAYEVEEMGLFETANNNVNIEYEPYKEPQTVRLQLDRPLTKWDKIEKRDGVYGIVYKHRTVDDLATLVKDNTIIYGSSGNRYFSIETKDANLNYDSSKVYSEVGLYKKDINVLYVPRVVINSFTVYVSDTDTIETAKEHLHYKVIYETDSEEFVPLPEETQLVLESLYAFDGTTVITVDSGEVETGIKLTYRKEK